MSDFLIFGRSDISERIEDLMVDVDTVVPKGRDV